MKPSFLTSKRRNFCNAIIYGQFFLPLALSLVSPLAFGATQAPIPETQTLLAFNVLLPQGASTTTLSLPVPQNLGALGVLYVPSAQCGGFQVNLETYNRRSPLTPTIIQNNKFLTRIQPVQGVKFNFLNQFALNQFCQVFLTQDVLAPQPSQRTLLGSLKFSGGFNPELAFNLPVPLKVEKVEVFKPQYCQNIDIIDSRLLLPTPTTREAALLSDLPVNSHIPALPRAESSLEENLEVSPIEALSPTNGGELAEANRSDQGQWYQISLSQPTIIRGVTFSISGPEAQSCEFPIYGWTK